MNKAQRPKYRKFVRYIDSGAVKLLMHIVTFAQKACYEITSISQKFVVYEKKTFHIDDFVVQ